MIALPPNFVTTKTKKGSMILNPNVLTKFTSRIGNKGIFLIFACSSLNDIIL
jgi:hypothetical protein